MTYWKIHNGTVVSFGEVMPTNFLLV